MDMTEEQIIAKLQTLKNIKPRENWVVFAKANIFGSEAVAFQPVKKPGFKEILSGMFGLTLQRKFIYSFTTIALMFAGVFGFAQYTLPGDMLFEVKKITEQSQAALVRESDVKSNVETFKKRSHDLSLVVKNNKGGNKVSAIREVKDAAKNLALAIKKDTALAKEVALEIQNNQTLLAVLSEEDLKETSGDLIKVVTIQLAGDLEAKIEKTETEAAFLAEIQLLVKAGKYQEALEKILLINEKEPTDKEIIE